MSEDNKDKAPLSIEKIIEKAIQEIVKVRVICKDHQYSSEKEKDNIRLVYPNYSNHNDETPNSNKKETYDAKDRLSEQEFKQCFIATLESFKNEHHFLYSVETPTEYKYKFYEKLSSENFPKCTKNKSEGRSANIDVTVYDSAHNNKFNHIEFKANQADKKDIIKDIVKLAHEGDNCTHYFLHILGNSDSESVSHILNKLYLPYSTQNLDADSSKFFEKELSRSYIDLKGTLKNTKIKIIIYILVSNYKYEDKPQKHYYRFCFNDFLESIDYEKEEINDIKKKIPEILSKIELRPLS